MGRWRVKLVWLCALASAAAAGWSGADTLRLKDGRVIEGTVVAERAGLVWFRHASGGLEKTEVFLVEQIAELLSDPASDQVDADAAPDAIGPEADGPGVEEPDAAPEEEAAAGLPVAVGSFGFLLPTRPSELAEGDRTPRTPDLVHFTPGGRLIVGSHGYAGIWDLTTGERVFEHNEDSPATGPFAFIDADGALVTYEYRQARPGRQGGASEVATRRDPETGRPMRGPRAAGRPSQGLELQLARLDGRMALVLGRTPGHPAVVRDPSVDPAAFDRGVLIQVMNLRTNRVDAILSAQSSRPGSEVRPGDLEIMHFALSGDGRRVVGVLRDGTINVWSTDRSALGTAIDSGVREGFPDHDAVAEWTDQDRTVVVRWKDRVLRVDPARGTAEEVRTRELRPISGPEFEAPSLDEPVQSGRERVVVSPDLSWSLNLVGLYLEREGARPIERERYVLTDMRAGREIGTIDSPIGEGFRGTSFSPDSRHVVIGTSGGAVHVFRIEALAAAAGGGFELGPTSPTQVLAPSPLHRSWDGMGPGSTIEFRTTRVDAAGRESSFVMVTEVLWRDARTGDIAVRSYDRDKGPPDDAAFDVVVARAPTMIAAMVPPSEADRGVRMIHADRPDAPLRRVSFGVLGEPRPCLLLEGGDGTITRTVWFCETVPGFLVRSERRVQGRVTETVELIAIHRR